MGKDYSQNDEVITESSRRNMTCREVMLVPREIPVYSETYQIQAATQIQRASQSFG